jgi:hypothetical protein
MASPGRAPFLGCTFVALLFLFANDNFRASKGELCAAFVELSVQVLTLFRRKTLARLKIVRPMSGSASVVANWQMAEQQQPKANTPQSF